MLEPWVMAVWIYRCHPKGHMPRQGQYTYSKTGERSPPYVWEAVNNTHHQKAGTSSAWGMPAPFHACSHE
jgi:hypothetical protein